MPRYAVHIRVTEDLWETCNPAITVLVDAHDDQMAELYARALLAPELDYDVQEIELAEEGEHA